MRFLYFFMSKQYISNGFLIILLSFNYLQLYYLWIKLLVFFSNWILSKAFLVAVLSFTFGYWMETHAKDLISLHILSLTVYFCKFWRYYVFFTNLTLIFYYSSWQMKKVQLLLYMTYIFFCGSISTLIPTSSLTYLLAH